METRGAQGGEAEANGADGLKDRGEDDEEMAASLIIRLELPVLNIDTHLRFRLRGSLPQWGDYVDRVQQVVEEFTTDLHDELTWMDSNGSGKKWELLREDTLQALRVWREKLSKAEECVARETRTKAHMQSMRQGYWKELMALREQVRQKEKAEKEGLCWVADEVIHFNERDFIMNDEVEEEIQRQVEERILRRVPCAKLGEPMADEGRVLEAYVSALPLSSPSLEPEPVEDTEAADDLEQPEDADDDELEVPLRVDRWTMTVEVPAASHAAAGDPLGAMNLREVADRGTDAEPPVELATRSVQTDTVPLRQASERPNYSPINDIFECPGLNMDAMSRIFVGVLERDQDTAARGGLSPTASAPISDDGGNTPSSAAAGEGGLPQASALALADVAEATEDGEGAGGLPAALARPSDKQQQAHPNRPSHTRASEDLLAVKPSTSLQPAAGRRQSQDLGRRQTCDLEAQQQSPQLPIGPALHTAATASSDIRALFQKHHVPFKPGEAGLSGSQVPPASQGQGPASPPQASDQVADPLPPLRGPKRPLGKPSRKVPLSRFRPEGEDDLKADGKGPLQEVIDEDRGIPAAEEGRSLATALLGIASANAGAPRQRAVTQQLLPTTEQSAPQRSSAGPGGRDESFPSAPQRVRRVSTTQFHSDSTGGDTQDLPLTMRVLRYNAKAFRTDPTGEDPNVEEKLAALGHTQSEGAAAMTRRCRGGANTEKLPGVWDDEAENLSPRAKQCVTSRMITADLDDALVDAVVRSKPLLKCKVFRNSQEREVKARREGGEAESSPRQRQAAPADRARLRSADPVAPAEEGVAQGQQSRKIQQCAAQDSEAARPRALQGLGPTAACTATSATSADPLPAARRRRSSDAGASLRGQRRQEGGVAMPIHPPVGAPDRVGGARESPEDDEGAAPEVCKYRSENLRANTQGILDVPHPGSPLLGLRSPRAAEVSARYQACGVGHAKTMAVFPDLADLSSPRRPSRLGVAPVTRKVASP